ncbi:MAG: hypothetical protein K2Y37_02940 [Pirellulales bacterium]|nr:hypothetical protein [Pirellulales bacterium]
MTGEKDAPATTPPMSITLGRMFLVAAELATWTEDERAWLKSRPKYQEYEGSLRDAIAEFRFKELLTTDQLVAFSNNEAWAPFQNRLDDLVERRVSLLDGFGQQVKGNLFSQRIDREHRGPSEPWR